MDKTDKGLERLLKAVANTRRLAILRCLKRRKEATVGDIAESIKLSFKSTSRHLGILSAADLLDREQRSLEVYYRIAEEIGAPISSLLSIL